MDSLLYTYTDYQGSLLALTDANGNVVQRYAYDPWGKRRNPNNWTQGDSRTSFLINRGYTGHEHLDAFGIINMNGRVYDPLTASFFSPDPYVTYPNNWINYNRYLYAMGNPFKFTDPDGENPLLIAAFVGGFINVAIKGVTGNLNSMGDFWGSFGIGALSGLAGGAAGQAVSGALNVATTLGGSIGNGTLIGAAGGFVGGAGNAWISGSGFGDGLKQGLIGGGIGALIGGIAGGISGGVQFQKQMCFFEEGIQKLGVNAESSVPMSDRYLELTRDAWFYKFEHLDKIDAFTVENVPAYYAKKMAEKGYNGLTVPTRTNSGIFTGRSSIYFNNTAFSSYKRLFFIWGMSCIM